MHAKTQNHQILPVIVVVSCILLLSTLFFIPAYAGSAEGEISLVAVGLNIDSGAITIKAANNTALDAKEKIAHYLDNGVSPKDIILTYNPWGGVEEQLPDTVKLADYDTDTIYFRVSPIPIGAVYKIGDVIDFGEGACVYAKFDDADTYSNMNYFYSQNAVGCQGLVTIDDVTYAKFIVGNTAMYLESGKKIAPTGFRVAHMSYDPYNKIYMFGFEPVN